MSKHIHVDIDNARTDEQRSVMEKIITADHCPFCFDNILQYHKQPILKEGEHWIVTTNQWPYDHTKVHLLAIYKEHAVQLNQLPPQSGQELLELMQWAQQEYSVPGGGLFMRFGDTDYSAGTVAHLHAQFIMPDISQPDFEPVRVKLGKQQRD